MRTFLVFICTALLWASSVFAQNPLSSGNSRLTVLEGQLSHVSKLPRPQGNPYPDCYYTAVLEVDHIVSGESIAKKVILVLPGFFSRQYAPEAKFKTGDKVHATLVPFDSMPETVRQTQQADDIEDVDLQFYFPQKIALVQQFEKLSNQVPFAETLQKRDESRDVPVDQKARAARQEAMRRDLDYINKLLAEHGGDWDRWYESLHDFRAEYSTQNAAKAHQWVGDSFFSAGQIPHDKVYVPEFVKSIIDFKKYLAERHVDLIVVRFPYKGEVVDDLFAPVPLDQVTNPYLLRMYKELLEADVEIVADIIPRAKAARYKYPLMYWYQDFNEPHPAEGMAWIVAQALSERLKRYEKIRNAEKKSYKLGKATTASMSRPASKYSVWPNNVFWPEGNLRFDPKQYVEFTSVLTGTGEEFVPKQGQDSPILLVGSSFVRYPSHEHGANVSTYLSYLTGIAPDILTRLGSDQSIPRTIAREGETVLKNRAVCLFPIVPWAFYGALDSPPILDKEKFRKMSLTSYAGKELQQEIKVAANTPAHVFTFSKEGDLTVKAMNKESGGGAAGSFSFSLPATVSGYPFFLVEVGTKPGDAAAIEATYGEQRHRVHKFYSQKNTEDDFIFKPGEDRTVNINISNIEPGFQTIIKYIKIYGLQR